ncbi:migration and invasion enhancer 1 [Athalia rosae]|uniref:migration and invasion enhancer 1 n=1 Tax=Athalia rosae TaxID=37344 RepID=UPI000A0ED599|nr:migration and invasion enhancer 1 [Athalia rosae]
MMTNVKIDVEYCGSCGHKKQFLEMSDIIRKTVPNAEISGTEGRQASFEVQMNGDLVYSKLQTLAFPDYEAVTDLAKDVSAGQPTRKIKKEQPIECSIS